MSKYLQLHYYILKRDLANILLVWWPRSVIALGVGDRSQVSFSLATLFSPVGLSSFSELKLLRTIKLCKMSLIMCDVNNQIT